MSNAFAYDTHIDNDSELDRISDAVNNRLSNDPQFLERIRSRTAQTDFRTRREHKATRG